MEWNWKSGASQDDLGYRSHYRKPLRMAFSQIGVPVK